MTSITEQRFLHPFKQCRRHCGDNVEAYIVIRTRHIVGLDHRLVKLQAKAHRHFAEVHRGVDAEADRHGEAVVALLFPVGDDIRACADAGAARAVKKANRLRLDFVRKALPELGFKGEDLEMRTMLFVGYHSWESPMFREISRKRRREQIARRVDLLTSK